MRKPTVAGNAYRWAYPAIEQMVRHRPAGALDFLQADAATKHFVALAVRGWEARHGRSERVLHQLARDIFSRPRPDILAGLWGTGFRKLSFLKRLPGRVMQRNQYDELVRTLSDPQLRHLLHACPKISSQDLAAIGHFTEPILAAASLRKVSRIGVDLFDYVLAVVRRHRPDLEDNDLATLLRDLSRTEGVSGWLRRVLRYANLPPPPWDGTETIRPLRSVGEIQVTGVELRNCLSDDDRSLLAVLGESYYYRVSGCYGPGVVSIAFDALLGGWRIESYRGPANAPLKPAAERYILEAFAAVGIRFFGNCPRERALDWCDD